MVICGGGTIGGNLRESSEESEDAFEFCFHGHLEHEDDVCCKSENEDFDHEADNLDTDPACELLSIRISIALLRVNIPAPKTARCFYQAMAWSCRGLR